MTREKSPLDQALDLLVYAPLGLAVTARTQLPDMVAKGRAQIEGQVTVARFIGQFAVKQGKTEIEKRLNAMSPAPVPVPAPDSVPEPAPVAEPDPVVAETLPSPAPARPAPPAADLAIPGYDALSASQVVQRLAGLASAELEQVRAYEVATRGRKTVLTKITQLQ